jgi:hypothetical protein
MSMAEAAEVTSRMNPRMLAALQRAAAEADRRGVHYIGTEHLLLALARDASTVAGRVLADLCSSPDGLQQRVDEALGTLERERFQARTAAIHDRSSTAAKQVIEQAQTESRDLDDNHVGTEHLLLAILGNQEASAALGTLGVSREDVLAVLFEEPGTSPAVFTPWTPRALRALERGAELCTGEISPNHFLLGLIYESVEFEAAGMKGPHHLREALAVKGRTFVELRSILESTLT